jgi:hypothetical protein
VDHQAPLVPLGLNSHDSPQFFGDIFFEPDDILIFYGLSRRGLRLHFMRQLFCLPHRKSPPRDFPCRLRLLGHIQRKDGSRVPHVNFVAQELFLHWLRQVQQPQQIAYRASRAPHRFRRHLMRHAEFTDKTLNALRLFQGIEIFPLNVFNQGNG